LICARLVIQSLFVLCALVLLAPHQGLADALPGNFRPTASHSTNIEKAIVVPPEVARRWRAIKIAVIDKTRGTENIYIIPVGIIYRVPSSTLTIVVDAFLPSFVMEGMTITSSSNEPFNPGAKVKISDNGTLVFQGWLFAKFPNTHAVTHPKYGFSLIGAVPMVR